MSITNTDGITDAVHRGVVERFAEGWRRPDPHGWDDLLAEDVVLRQPLMPDGVGRDHWQQEFARLQDFLPDLRGEVLGWAGAGDVVYIDISCTATAGGRPLRFRAVDRLTITSDGVVTRRDSFLDPTSVSVALLSRPRAWPAWWRSGVGPVTGRRVLLAATRSDTEPGAPHTGRAHRSGIGWPRRTARTLGLIRTCVGTASLLHPRLAYRSLNRDVATPPVGGFLARAFGVRDLAIALATLSPDEHTARTGVRLGLLADIADVVSILAGRRSGGITRHGALLIGGPAAVFSVAGAAALAGERAEPSARAR